MRKPRKPKGPAKVKAMAKSATRKAMARRRKK